MAVIDCLEAIEIENTNGQQFTATLALRNHHLEAIGEQYPVGQAGQGIKVCLVLELGFAGDQLGNVAGGDYRPAFSCCPIDRKTANTQPALGIVNALHAGYRLPAAR